jgi:hypothetical protein
MDFPPPLELAVYVLAVIVLAAVVLGGFVDRSE